MRALAGHKASTLLSATSGCQCGLARERGEWGLPLFSFTYDDAGCKYHEAKPIDFIFVGFGAKLNDDLDEVKKCYI